MKIILSHIRTVHSHDPNFFVPCGLKGCGTTARSFSALYLHIYRKHSDVISKRTKTSSVFQSEGEIQSGSTSTTDPSNISGENACYIKGWSLVKSACM